MLISFLAIESIVVVFAQPTCINLCTIGFPGHVVVMKWLDAAVSRYPVAGWISGSSSIVSNLFLTLLYFSLFVTNVARFFLHEGNLLCTTGWLILLLFLVLLYISSSFPCLQFLFFRVAQSGWWKQMQVIPPIQLSMVASSLWPSFLYGEVLLVCFGGKSNPHKWQ